MGGEVAYAYVISTSLTLCDCGGQLRGFCLVRITVTIEVHCSVGLHTSWRQK